MNYTIEDRISINEVGTQVFDDTVGLCLGHTYHLRYQQRTNGTVPIELAPASGLRDAVMTATEFERWWAKA